MLLGMTETDWRNRVRAEDELLEQLAAATKQASQRRAAALLEGVAELGTATAVGNEFGITQQAVSKAIAKYRSALDQTTE